MKRIDAIESLKSGQSLALVSRDATGSCFTCTSVWLSDDGADIEIAHPTRDRGHVRVLDAQLSGLRLA